VGCSSIEVGDVLLKSLNDRDDELREKLVKLKKVFEDKGLSGDIIMSLSNADAEHIMDDLDIGDSRLRLLLKIQLNNHKTTTSKRKNSRKNDDFMTIEDNHEHILSEVPQKLKNFVDKSGRYVYKDGSVYNGFYKESKNKKCIRRHGYGMYITASQTLIGTWEDDVLQSAAVQLKDTTYYNGDLIEDKKEGYMKIGKGVLCNNQGFKFEGQFLQDGFVEGSIYFPYNSKKNISKINGTYRNRKLNGPGEIVYKNGCLVVGEFVNGVMKGAYVLEPNGNRIDGNSNLKIICDFNAIYIEKNDTSEMTPSNDANNSRHEQHIYKNGYQAHVSEAIQKSQEEKEQKQTDIIVNNKEPQSSSSGNNDTERVSKINSQSLKMILSRPFIADPSGFHYSNGTRNNSGNQQQFDHQTNIFETNEKSQMSFDQHTIDQHKHEQMHRQMDINNNEACRIADTNGMRYNSLHEQQFDHMDYHTQHLKSSNSIISQYQQNEKDYDQYQQNEEYDHTATSILSSYNKMTYKNST